MVISMPNSAKITRAEPVVLRRPARPSYPSCVNRSRAVPEFIKVPLSHGKVALIDPEDAERVMGISWHAVRNPREGWRAQTKILVGDRWKTVKLHRVILGTPDGVEVDHQNGNSLDCRRGNLRECTSAQNKQNRRRYRTSKSPYKGVYFANRERLWVAEIQCNKKRQRLGYFQTAKEAALAYDVAARELHKDFARLNFPLDGEGRAR